jgi:hypothetical protein
MQKFGVIIFGLALGLSLIRPAPAAAYTWDMICSGNQLNLCASVSVTQVGNTVTVTVTNLSNGLLNGIGLAGPGWATLAPAPAGWTFSTSGSWSAFNIAGSANGSGSGIANQGHLAFQFTLWGSTLDYSTLAFSFAGEVFEPGGEEVGTGSGEEGFPEGGLNPDGSEIPMDATSVPEPGTLLMLGTGLAGVVAVRRRRREEGLE